MLYLGSIPNFLERCIWNQISIWIFQLFRPFCGISAEDKGYICHNSWNNKNFCLSKFMEHIIEITHYCNANSQSKTQQCVPAKNKGGILLIFQDLPKINSFGICTLIFHRRLAQLLLFLPRNISNSFFLIFPDLLIIICKFHGIFIKSACTFHLPHSKKYQNNHNDI